MSPSLLSQRDAAAVCGVSRSTIRRRRDAGRFPNAVQDGVLGWLIPEDDLRAAGLQLSRSAVPAGRIEAD
ncbi:helix-turn-helix domain-containing protein, partial [Streptomyces decoyicus]|uniref:helix-turn-helix transcriptional regulator n=1 Tax=Streptomyces decoyicus TaxID=249567 RepID=UPI0033DB6109